MAQSGHQSIQIGDRVRSYVLPGFSDRDYITGIVVGYCQIAGFPGLIIESESRTTKGQDDPCRRRFLEPLDCVTHVGTGLRRHLALPWVA